MGGFKPSRADIAGATTVGSVQTDLHQFTGSVDITGSLKLNGSSVTGGGGGGGAVANYTNSGNNRVITSVDSDTINGEANLTFDGTKMGVGSNHTPTAVLHVSSSTTTLPLFRVDQHDQAGSKPILFVTGSGLVGIGTAAPREDSDNTNRVHILGEEGADQGQNPVDNTLLMLENNNHAGIQFMTPNDKSGMLVWGDANAARVSHLYYHHSDARWHFDGATYGDEAMTVRSTGDSVNIGSANAAHMITSKAALHISSSTGGTDIGGPVLLRVDHGNQPGAQPIMLVTGSGRVGIGVADPDTTLEVLSTTTQQKWSYDSDSFAKITVADGGDTTIATSESGDIVLDPGSGAIFFDRAGNRLRFDMSTGTSFIQNDISNGSIGFRLNAVGTSGIPEVFRIDGTGIGAILVSGTVGTYPGGDAAINFRDTANSINSPGSNRLTITSPTLEVTGTLAVSGTVGSVAIQTLNVAGGAAGVGGLVNVTDGNTIIDATSLANNAFYTYGIADGAFAGQQKNIIFKLNAGGAILNSNGAELTGSNIAIVSPGASTSTLTVSGSSGGGGFFVTPNAATQLLWDGTKWQVLSTTNVAYASA
mgnify:CR=1 FL=1